MLHSTGAPLPLLAARLRALLRRSPRDARQSELVLDPRVHTAAFRGAVIRIPPSEHALLRVLAARGGQPVSREVLSLELRGVPWNGQNRWIDTRVRRLRRRLAPLGPTIIAVRGQGYQLST